MSFGIPVGATAVVGLGVSGQAIIRHLAARGCSLVALDGNPDSPGVTWVRTHYPDVPVWAGDLAALDLTPAAEVVLSPGIDPHQPVFEAVRERVVGEIGIFARHLPAGMQVVAITGSNAKSTVTTLVGAMAEAAGHRPGIGGNLGVPALQLLDEGDHDLYVLELSSFQLETTPSLRTRVSAFLNLSEDHLNRHGDMAGYRAAKQRIFLDAQHAVVNADDPATWPDGEPAYEVILFGLDAPGEAEWGIISDAGGKLWLAHGVLMVMRLDELPLQGLHHYANALAALAIGTAMGWPIDAMCSVLRSFKGLEHRAQIVGEFDGIRWIDDSKGTNVGASLAAIEGIGPTIDGQLIWLGGGIGKGADFTPLAEPLARHARAAILFGRDAALIEQALDGAVPVHHANTMVEAQELALTLAEPGDVVLLSPACASQDQFRNYNERGNIFRDKVIALDARRHR
ncbi:UDP-N-acetylmuramoyl-L-alanine--D-glutamate ligase [Zymobacter sp. IVIA_5232.4 C2]|uniref:UDP-N-acetylmuramoyl-L-alanine--D-glutamate ligase n=1 Tax=Zymobacter sp. IVIA_5232.4 C2 TaxID=3394855 RepID=UPI0039C2AEC3